MLGSHLDQAINVFLNQKTKRGLQCFLGMSGYYHSFCRSFSDVVSPLSNLLLQSKNFVGCPACQDAFKAVKKPASAPVLSNLDFSNPFKLEVDASGSRSGAVLQE